MSDSTLLAFPLRGGSRVKGGRRKHGLAGAARGRLRGARWRTQCPPWGLGRPVPPPPVAVTAATRAAAAMLRRRGDACCAARGYALLLVALAPAATLADASHRKLAHGQAPALRTLLSESAPVAARAAAFGAPPAAARPQPLMHLPGVVRWLFTHPLLLLTLLASLALGVVYGADAFLFLADRERYQQLQRERAEVEAETQRRQRKLQQGESSPLLMADASSSTLAAAL